ncbi:hypothetical protein ES703_53612 [subsurface metagenome]
MLPNLLPLVLAAGVGGLGVVAVAALAPKR